MDEFFVYLLFGHIVGDYFMQPLWMALNKKDLMVIGGFHCFIYTAAVWSCTVLYDNYNMQIGMSIVWFLIIFCLHALVDLTNIVDKFLNILSGRSYENADTFIRENKGLKNPASIYMISYTAIVQTVIDNSIHVFGAYFAYNILHNYWRW